MFESVALAHAAATIFMAGLIWFVQIVHYPLFLQAADLRQYGAAHSRLTTRVVAVPMVIELVTAAALLWLVPGWLTGIGFVLVLGVWAVTAGVQVPQHARIARTGDRQAVVDLVRGNWWRTWAWSARAQIALLLLLA